MDKRYTREYTAVLCDDCAQPVHDQQGDIKDRAALNEALRAEGCFIGRKIVLCKTCIDAGMRNSEVIAKVRELYPKATYE